MMGLLEGLQECRLERSAVNMMFLAQEESDRAAFHRDIDVAILEKKQAMGKVGVNRTPACQPRKSLLDKSCLVVLGDFRSQSLHKRIIQSASRNYGVVKGMAFSYHVKSGSVFLSRKLSLVVALLWGWIK
jgi:hypothetical protein